jgi:hypothetical protein
MQIPDNLREALEAGGEMACFAMVIDEVAGIVIKATDSDIKRAICVDSRQGYDESMSENLLIPVEQKDVALYEDNITAVRADDGRVYVSIRHMCRALGLDENGQRQRMRRHAVLGRGLGVCKIHTPGGAQETAVLRVDLVPLWLSGVRASMVSEEIRPKLVQFQEQAAAVLWEAFQDGRLSADSDFDELLAQASPDAVEAYQVALAVVKLARQQIVMEARLDDYGRRLDNIEASLGDPDRYVSKEQAARISQGVRAIGHVLSKRSGRSEYGAVYGELYRSFDTSSYRELPASQYEQAMKWLNAWYQRLTNSDIPF